MGRASRDKWNRRLHLLAREEAERRRSDEQRAQPEVEGAGPSFSPVLFWTDWFRQTAKAEGPAKAVIAKRARPGKSLVRVVRFMRVSSVPSLVLVLLCIRDGWLRHGPIPGPHFAGDTIVRPADGAPHPRAGRRWRPVPARSGPVPSAPARLRLRQGRGRPEAGRCPAAGM